MENDEIKSGRWRYTHQGIAFDKEGKLLDGQHRLKAIIEAGVAVKMVVAFGVDRGEFTVLDRGMTRNMSTITGIPPFFAECYVLLLSMTSQLNRPSPDDVYLIHNYLYNKASSLQNTTNSAIRYYSSAPIRTGAIISLEEGERESYVLDVYKNLVLQKAESMRQLPTVALALITSHNKESNGISRSSGNTGYIWRIETYARARFLFTESNANHNQIQIRASLLESYKHEVSDIVRKALEASPDHNQISLLKQLHERDKQDIEKLHKQLMRKTVLDIDAEHSKLSMEAKD